MYVLLEKSGGNTVSASFFGPVQGLISNLHDRSLFGMAAVCLSNPDADCHGGCFGLCLGAS